MYYLWLSAKEKYIFDCASFCMNNSGPNFFGASFVCFAGGAALQGCNLHHKLRLLAAFSYATLMCCKLRLQRRIWCSAATTTCKRVARSTRPGQSEARYDSQFSAAQIVLSARHVSCVVLHASSATLWCWVVFEHSLYTLTRGTLQI